MAALYLIPNIISESDWQNVLPTSILTVVSETRFYIVENIRNTRRFLKQINQDIDIDSLMFFELNKHTQVKELPEFLKPLENGENVAVVSEAGCPGIADPGAEIVKIAHQKNFRVIPLVGPSSVTLSLMASGLNGQNFTFNGYLPVKQQERIKTILNLEKKIAATGQAQIFIETPYRNNQMLNDLLKYCSSSTLLCIAADVTGKNEFIATKPIAEWRKKTPDLHKQPAIFLLGK